MPIEGPLRELALPDVFQLLDLSRKTGMLRVRSQLRGDEGVVYFETGRVVQATLRGKPVPAVNAGTMSEREIERKLRGQIEGAVYDMMTWREGFFSFEEGDLADVPAAARVKIATESLLMESARRIDEWSRIADKVPHLLVVPVLAQVSDEHQPQLDLLPHEWEVLSLIDGTRDLRAIAGALGRGEFEAAKVVYGLITTGVVEIKRTRPVSASIPVIPAPALVPDAPPPPPPPPPPNPEIRASYARALSSVYGGDFSVARASWERFLALAPDAPEAPRVRAALDALSRMQAAIEALHG